MNAQAKSTASLLFFDTETTGLPLWQEPSEDPRQPYIVQIAALHLDDDGTEISRFCEIVKPDGGYTIPDEVVAVHGITTERAEAEGRPLVEVLDWFLKPGFHSHADALLVAHGLGFDKRMVRIQLKRLGMEVEAEAFQARRGFCTMNEAKPICRIPPTNAMMATGRKTWKTPSLAEAYQHFIGKKIAGAHDAMVGAEACRDIYFAIRAQKEGSAA